MSLPEQVLRDAPSMAWSCGTLAAGDAQMDAIAKDASNVSIVINCAWLGALFLRDRVCMLYVVFAQEARSADLRNLLQQSGVPPKDTAKMLRQLAALSASMPPPSTPVKRPKLDSPISPLLCAVQHATPPSMMPAPMTDGH